MLFRKQDQLPPDLQAFDRMLRAEKPSLPEARMQDIGSRARARAQASMHLSQQHSHKESFLRSRIAIGFMLAFGFLFSGAGVGMAVTGVGNGQSAATNQYTNAVATPTPTPAAGQAPAATETPSAGALPEQNSGNGNTLAPDNGDVAGETDEQQPEEAGNLPASEEGGSAPARTAPAGKNGAAPAAAQNTEVRQLGAEAGGEELPFTGFVAIPVMLLGFALLTTGFVLRRSSGTDA